MVAGVLTARAPARGRFFSVWEILDADWSMALAMALAMALGRWS